MRILFNNLVDSATLTASTSNSNFPESNLQTIQAERTWRSSTLSVNIVFDLGSAQSVSALAFANHNLSANITLEANSSDSWGSPAKSETLTPTTGTNFHTFTSESYRYWRLVISESGIEYVEIGRLALGTYLTLPMLANDAQFPRRTTSRRSFSRSRQSFFDVGKRYRAASLTFREIEAADFDDFIAMHQYTDEAPVFLEFSETTTEDPMYAVVSPEYDMSLPRSVRYEVGLDFEEVF